MFILGGFDPGGGNTWSTYYFPMVSVGYGYSFKINSKVYMRPSIDIGFQINPVNIGLSVVFWLHKCAAWKGHDLIRSLNCLFEDIERD